VWPTPPSRPSTNCSYTFTPRSVGIERGIRRQHRKCQQLKRHQRLHSPPGRPVRAGWPGHPLGLTMENLLARRRKTQQQKIRPLEIQRRSIPSVFVARQGGSFSISMFRSGTGLASRPFASPAHLLTRTSALLSAPSGDHPRGTPRKLRAERRDGNRRRILAPPRSPDSVPSAAEFGAMPYCDREKVDHRIRGHTGEWIDRLQSASALA